MNIRPLSDLHLEFYRDGYSCPEPLETETSKEDTVVVLAGDICTGTRAIPWIDSWCYKFKAVIYVLGNHEYYGQTYNDLIDKIKKEVEAYQLDNVYLLQDDSVLIDDVRFLGSTLWSDMNNLDSSVMSAARWGMNDYRKIKERNSVNIYHSLNVETTIKSHSESKKYLEEELAKEGDWDHTVVVTHHLPSYQMIEEKYTGDHLNGAYASNLDELIEEGEADLWICGHSHAAQQKQIGNTLVVQNSFGYKEIDEVKDFNLNLNIELGETQ